MDNVNIILLDKNLAQYARHRFTSIELSDIFEYFDSEKWDGLLLDVRSLNTVSAPRYYWKRGTLRHRFIGHPRLYIASVGIKKDSLPEDRYDVETSRLEGFILRTKNISEEDCFWQVEPVYE